MRRESIMVVTILLGMLVLAFNPSANAAWSASPQITSSVDGSGNTILTIQFDFSQMSSPPTSSHYPTAFQVRTSSDGMFWTELPAVPISTIPATTVFTETYNLGSVTGTIQVQAKLNCSVHGWSEWGPSPAIPTPEFPIGTIPVTLLLTVIGSLFLLRRRLESPA